jgi:hypothetical protein
LTYMCAQYLKPIHPTNPLPCHLSPPTSTPSWQNLFYLPVLWFCIGKKKRMTFLLIWDKDSYMVIFSCIKVLWPQLVHLLYFYSFYLSPFLMVVSTSLNFLYSFLYREDIICR